LLGVLLEDSDVGIPGGLGGVVSAEGSGVLELERLTRLMDGLGDLGWEVSHLSQIEVDGVVFSVVLGCAESGGTACGCGTRCDAGHWDIGYVTVELGLDARELEGARIVVVDGGLTRGHPVLGLLSGDIRDGGALTVPGSEGTELVGWHPEEWQHGGEGESWGQLLESSGSGRALEALGSYSKITGSGGVLHVVDLIGG